ncbi:MAG: hypothetical protein WC595_04790 [Candidatus Nanoarchaeia archaeon]
MGKKDLNQPTYSEIELSVWIMSLLFLGLILILFTGFIAYNWGEDNGYKEGKTIGIKVGVKAGIDEGLKTGFIQGTDFGTKSGKVTGGNAVMNCLNGCDTGTGILNNCYSAGCINQCIQNIR